MGRGPGSLPTAKSTEAGGAGGHAKLPRSKRFTQSHKPEPSQHNTLRRVREALQNKK